jgi:type I restriction-modification system DNA methylase subunit
MVNYSCERCCKSFSQKSQYNSHNRSKTPCENNAEKNKTLDDTVDEEKFKNLSLFAKNGNKDEQPKEEKDETETDSEYSELSRKLTTKINKTEKKQNGIYFTPPQTIHKNIKFLQPFMKNITTILEPSCGSCEYILKLNNINPKVYITGIELNKTIFESIEPYDSDSNNITLINDNYLTRDFDTKYDLIIGNPPYFVMKKSEVEKSYHDYFDGRPNIFILFIIKSLELLNNKGIISFVLPKNFLNCLYYDKTRKHIINNYKILNIIECDDKYIETQQNTIILIIQNEKSTGNNTSYSITISEFTIFGTDDNIKILKSLYDDSKTLFDLGFNVNVGNVVWNQCKKDLTDDQTKTHLIYSSDITNNILSIKNYLNEDKKNYINKKGDTAPLLVINRGYGVGSYNFNYCIINENEDDNMSYLVENHLICIRNSHPLSNENLIQKYQQIIKSFQNKKTTEFINIYFGNNAMNTTELCKILPIYDI